MVGYVKHLEIESSSIIEKKTKMKSLGKIYALKEQLKANNSFKIKKINWKSTPFSLVKV